MAEKVPWYGPGKTKIDYINALSTAPIDYSGWDGSICFLLKILFYYILTKYHPQEKEAVVSVVGSELFSVFKVKSSRTSLIRIHHLILTLSAVLSGGSMTASGNTWLAGFLQYHFHRLSKSKDDAWKSIGLVYGDDGNLDRTIFTKFCTYVSTTFGIKATPEPKYAPGVVPFLGKIFTDNKGSLSPDRILYKFALSFSNYKDLDNILLKWSGFYNPKVPITDQIPVFSILGQMAFNQLHKQKKFKQALENHTKWKSMDYLGKCNQDLFIYRMGKTKYIEFLQEFTKTIKSIKVLDIGVVKNLVALVNKHTWEYFPTPTTIKPNVTLFLDGVMYQSNEYDGDYNHEAIINYFKLAPKFEIFKLYFKNKSTRTVLKSWRHVVYNTYNTLIQTAKAKKLKKKYEIEREHFMEKTAYLRNNEGKNSNKKKQITQARGPNHAGPNKKIKSQNYNTISTRTTKQQDGKQQTKEKSEKSKPKTKTTKKTKYIKIKE